MLKAINKSVRDNTQIAKVKGDKIEVVSKSGRHTAFKYSFKIDEVRSYNPTFNQSYNINEFVTTKIKRLNLEWFDFTDPLLQRIIDAQMYCLLELLNKMEG